MNHQSSHHHHHQYYHHPQNSALNPNSMSNPQQFYDSQEDYGSFEYLLDMKQTKICDVWAYNFEDEMKKLLSLIDKYNIIAMDTQFPGILINRSELDQRYYSEEDCQYVLIKTNVEQTKMIQIGLSIADENGNVPYPICTWQFNFKWDKQKERIADPSYELLVRAGVRFDKLATDGIDFDLFAEYFTGSGLILNPDVKWVVFHGSSDFAYLLRLCLNEQLPNSIDQFYKCMKLYFPKIYDLKYIIKDVPSLKDVGLAKLSYEIGCSRIGPQHQAGSDSLLTLCCYFKMIEQKQLFGPRQFFNCIGVIFGIGLGYMKNHQSSSLSNGINLSNITSGANTSYMSSSNSNSHHMMREYDYRMGGNNGTGNSNDYNNGMYYDSNGTNHYLSQLHHHGFGTGNQGNGSYNYNQGQSQYHMIYPSGNGSNNNNGNNDRRY